MIIVSLLYPKHQLRNCHSIQSDVGANLGLVGPSQGLHNVFLAEGCLSLAHLGARRVALRRPRGRIKNRSNIITMWPFHWREKSLHVLLLAARRTDRAASNSTCSDFCVHPPRVYLPILFFPGSFPSCLAAHQTWDVEPMLIQCCIIVCNTGRAYILFKIGSTSHIC